MSEESRPEKPEKLQGKASNKDITPMLRGWDYEPGTINVRKVAGIDGAEIANALDLGLLQMELSGRPDGEQQFGCESLLDYHEKQLAKLLAPAGRRNRVSPDQQRMPIPPRGGGDVLPPIP